LDGTNVAGRSAAEIKLILNTKVAIKAVASAPPLHAIERDGTVGVESPIRADLVGIVENLLMLGEEMIVMWANNNLRFPQF
jgi:hypothetical protein